jgi:outer membrane protein TolC
LSKIAKSFRVKVDDLLACLLIFSLSLLPLSGWCQENTAPGPVTLSLEDTIAIAFKNNKDIQIQEKEITAAKAGIMEARSEFLPQLSAEVGYTRNGAVLNSTPPPNPKKDIGIFTGYKNDNQAGIAMTESIYNGGASIANFKQAKINFTSQGETLRAKKLDVEFEAKRLYYGLLLGYETLRITQELVDNAQAHYEDVKNRFEQGISSRFDLLQSKVQVSLYIPELVKAKNAVDLLMADLKKLLSLRMQDELALKDSRLDYSQIEVREDEFLKIAYLNSPEMNLKTLGIDMNKWAIEMAKAGWRPQLSANAGYNFNSNSWGNMYNSKHSNWYSGISVGLSIFDGFATKAKVDAAKARYAEAYLSKANLSDQIAVDIRQGCLDLKEAQAIIDSQRDNIGEAREALRIANVSYDNGEGTNLDVLDAQLALSQAEENYVQGIYDYLMAQAYLDRTMGIMLVKGAENEKKN